MIISDLNIILPEIILSVYAMLALVGAVYTAKDALSEEIQNATIANRMDVNQHSVVANSSLAV